jgi:hypothetical protein
MINYFDMEYSGSGFKFAVMNLMGESILICWKSVAITTLCRARDVPCTLTYAIP